RSREGDACEFQHPSSMSSGSITGGSHAFEARQRMGRFRAWPGLTARRRTVAHFSGDIMKETKTVSGTPEARAAMHEMMAAFEAFKGANDARLDEIERKSAADVLLEEKVARIDQAVGAAQARLDRAASEARRPELGGGAPPVPAGARARRRRVAGDARRPELGGGALSVAAVGRASCPMEGEGTKAAFDGYLKTGASFGLELKAGLSTAANSAGYVVPEQTERAIERR